MRLYVLTNNDGDYLSSYDLGTGAKFYTNDLPNALAYENKFVAETMAQLLACNVKPV